MVLGLFSERPLVEECQILRVSNFTRKAYVDIKELYKKINRSEIDLRDELSVKKFLNLIEKTTEIKLIQNREKQYYSKTNKISLTYTKSNLNKGFIFWFVCNACRRRARFLYFPPNSEKLLCRVCHRLSYMKQNKKTDKLIKKLIQNPQKMLFYSIQGSLKEILSMIQAKQIIDLAKEEAKKKFDKVCKNINNYNSTQKKGEVF